MIAIEFTAATYNILADSYVRPDRYPLSPPEALAPAPRRQLLLARIAALDVDLQCLQEVGLAAHEAIAERLGDGYLGVHAPRRRHPDGASLFLRRSRFALSRHDPLHYTSRGSDNQLALIAELTLGTHRLQVACTHLQWCRDDTPAEAHIGRAQLSELLDHLPPADTRLIAGDLNATSQSPVIHAARQRGLALGAAKQRPWDTCNAPAQARLSTPHSRPRSAPGSAPPAAPRHTDAVAARALRPPPAAHHLPPRRTMIPVSGPSCRSAAGPP